MKELLWLEDARMWLTKEAHQRRRIDLLVALAMFLTSLASVAFGVWMLGPPISTGVLLVMGICYLVYGRLTEPSISYAETSRPRRLGVIRNPLMTRGVYEQAVVDWTYAIGFLMAPIHLVVEAGRLLARRRNLRALESETAVGMVALLAEKRTAVALADLTPQFADAELVLGVLRHTRGVVILRNPDRVSLTDPVIDEIRAE